MNALTRHRSHGPGLLDDFFRDFAPGFFIQPLHGDPLPTQIRLDVRERDDAFELEAEIPGVKKDDIQVEIDGNVVSLRAEVRQQDSKTQGRSLRSERYYGSVSRAVQLPTDVDESRCKAKYDEGVLRLTLPKKADSRSQRRLAIE
ncbi:MAG TPA: Hsp20/alpha crystallin family protein [Ramlibacter sp.]